MYTLGKYLSRSCCCCCRCSRDIMTLFSNERWRYNKVRQNGMSMRRTNTCYTATKRLLLKWWANSDALKLNLFSSPINIRLDAPKLICLFASVDQVQCILCENEISVELASKKIVRTSQETAVKEKCCDKKKRKNKHADLLRHLFARIIDGY